MSSTEGPCSHGLELLERVAAALNPAVLTQQVLEPIELAMNCFQTAQLSASNNDEFLEVVGSFVRHLHWQGACTPLRTSIAESRARALEMLEKQYEGVFASGYVGAFLDATRPEGPGVEGVLATLAGLVAKEEVQHRTASALVRLISPADWSAQRRLVAQLMSSLGPSLPSHLDERPVESFVSAYRELLAVFLDWEGFLGASWRTTRTLNQYRSSRAS